MKLQHPHLVYVGKLILAEKREKMILFHSDLDNTLIYSYKHDIGPDKTCVEYYQGKELSFMKPSWIEAVKQIRSKLLFVPTTTRTKEQYQRIELGIGVPEYALVCNGGVLLRDGEADEAWYKESLRLIADAQEELMVAEELLQTDAERELDVKFIDQLFLFTKSRKPKESVARLRERLDKAKVDVFSIGIKVYVLPKGLDKGSGLVRLKKELGAKMSLAAGDSDFDKSMLLAADAGFCPSGLFSKKPETVLEFPTEIFTHSMLHSVLSLQQ